MIPILIVAGTLFKAANIRMRKQIKLLNTIKSTEKVNATASR